ncbi:MAG: hypothetical protein ACOZIN_04905 [Myxococcota bacterium]
MISIAVGCVAALLAAAEPIRIAAPGLSMVNLEPKLTGFYTGTLAQQLNYQGVRVVTSEDLAALLGFERQQQLLGCPDEVCRAQVTGDLGVQGLMVGQVAKTSESYRLEVRVLEAGTGKPLAAASATSPSEDGLVRSFRDVAVQLAAQLSQKLGRALIPDTARVTTRWGTTKRLSWVPFGVGMAGLVTGGAGLSMAQGSYGKLTSATPDRALTPAQSEQLVASGKTQQTVGWAGVGVGAACLLAAGALWWFGGDEEVTSGVAWSPAGAGLGFVGVW